MDNVHKETYTTGEWRVGCILFLQIKQDNYVGFINTMVTEEQSEKMHM